jgi:hypothetical protein
VIGGSDILLISKIKITQHCTFIKHNVLSLLVAVIKFHCAQASHHEIRFTRSRLYGGFTLRPQYPRRKISRDKSLGRRVVSKAK